jgi:hypothetical protein
MRPDEPHASAWPVISLTTAATMRGSAAVPRDEDGTEHVRMQQVVKVIVAAQTRALDGRRSDVSGEPLVLLPVQLEWHGM